MVWRGCAGAICRYTGNRTGGFSAEKGFAFFSVMEKTSRVIPNQEPAPRHCRTPIMNWYYAEAGQQKGPVTDEQLDGLAAEGVVKPDTLVWRDGLPNWQPYSTARGGGAPPPIATGGAGVVCSQCGKTFNADEVVSLGGGMVCAACKPVAIQRLKEGVGGGGGTPGATMTVDELCARDYDVDIGDLISKGWGLLSKNFGTVLGATLLVYLVLGVVSLVPFGIGALAQLIIQGPLLGGLYCFYLKQIRTGTGTVGDGFSGFGPRFGQLMLGSIVSGILSGLCLLPGAIVIALAVIPMLASRGQGGGAAAAAGGIVIVGVILLFIGLLGFAYLAVGWAFTLPLVADKRMDFWPAMSLSRRMVSKHWWMVFFTFFVGGIIAMLGVLGCIVGVFVTMCITMGMSSHLYERIFGPLAPAEG